MEDPAGKRWQVEADGSLTEEIEVITKLEQHHLDALAAAGVDPAKVQKMPWTQILTLVQALLAIMSNLPKGATPA